LTPALFFCEKNVFNKKSVLNLEVTKGAIVKGEEAIASSPLYGQRKSRTMPKSKQGISRGDNAWDNDGFGGRGRKETR
jgi:hypothetical protein